MRRRLPSLNALLAFEAAARLGGFTSAARELGVAQPAVTRHIANLEDWLGTKLFKRNGNSVELSVDGYAIAELVTPAFDRLELGLGQHVAMREDQLVIGASLGMMHMWLMPQITAMREATKGVTINFVTSENYADFDTPEIDLSIRFGSGNWPGMRAELLFTEKTHVVTSPRFLAQHPELDERDLIGTLRPEWLLEHGDPHNYSWLTWQLWYAHFGHEMPQMPGNRDIHNYPTVLDMVRCDEGVALGYVGLDDDLVEAGEIIRLGPCLHRPDFGYYLLSDNSRKQSSACRKLRSVLTGSGGA